MLNLIIILALTGGQISTFDYYRVAIDNYNKVLNKQVQAESVIWKDISTGNQYMDRFDYIFTREGHIRNIEPLLLKAVAVVESGMHSHAVSYAGAQGIMQLMPQTAELLDVEDPFDPKENIRGGAIHLSYLLKKHRGSVKLTLAEYYCGPFKNKIPRVAVPYVRKVMCIYENLKGG